MEAATDKAHNRVLAEKLTYALQKKYDTKKDQDAISETFCVLQTELSTMVHKWTSCKSNTETQDPKKYYKCTSTSQENNHAVP